MSPRQQADLDRQVARRLGESVQEIARRGFSLCRVHEYDDEHALFGYDRYQAYKAD